MMQVNTIKKGIVIDHIRSGRGIKLFHALGLDNPDYSVCLITNVASGKMETKDIIKIDNEINLDYTVLGFIDPTVTINVIDNGAIIEKAKLTLPDRIEKVIACRNPRCITTIEQELVQRFYLANKQKGEYRCEYCDEAYKPE
jgi:aspartate carbamoyltransferase regulatory subunit